MGLRGIMTANKNVWLLIQDNSLPENGSHSRHFFFAKHLLKKEYRPVVFVASKPRCSQKQMIAGKESFLVDESYGFPFVYIRCNNYKNSMKKRLVATAEYHIRLNRYVDEFVKRFGEPDVVLGSSAYPITPVLARKIAKKYTAKSICEVRDLWPLSLEEYGIIKRDGAIARMMYRLEKSNYKNADAIVFTMEGGRQYIIDRGWNTEQGGPVDLKKVHSINNGIDLDAYYANLDKHPFQNEALSQSRGRAIVYAGSVRKANGLDFLVDVAKEAQDLPVSFIVFGDGGEREELSAKAQRLGLDNIHFEGSISKESVPSALSQGMMAIMCSSSQVSLSQYGMSQNKLFDYLAGGKPVISNLPSRYSIVNEYECGIERSFKTAKDCAETIRMMVADSDAMKRWGENAASTAVLFSFDRLTDKLIGAIEGDIDGNKL